jgi:branched-chain amino acid transport system substrate-binding protein
VDSSPRTEIARDWVAANDARSVQKGGGPRRWRLLLAAFAAGCLVLTACSSNKNAESASSGNSASSSNYTLGYITDESGSPEAGESAIFREDIQADVAAVNARGGIHGHPLKLKICDSQTSDSGSAACGQEMASSHVLGVLDLSGENSDLAFLQAAGIPDFNSGGFQQQWTERNSVTLNNESSLVTSAGFVVLAKHAGCRSLGVVVASFPAAFTSIMDTAYSQFGPKFGVHIATYITVPENAADVAPYVTQAVSKGIDCIALIGLGAPEISALTAMVNEPKNIKILVGIAYVSSPQEESTLQPIVNELGGSSRLIVLTIGEGSANEDTNPAVKEWVNDSTNYGPKPPDLDTVNQTDWAEIQLFVKAADAAYPNVTPKAVLDYINGLKEYCPGVFPCVSFTNPPANPWGPRVVGAWIAQAKWTPALNFPVVGPFISFINGDTTTKLTQ